MFEAYKNFNDCLIKKGIGYFSAKSAVKSLKRFSSLRINKLSANIAPSLHLNVGIFNQIARIIGEPKTHFKVRPVFNLCRQERKVFCKNLLCKLIYKHSCHPAKTMTCAVRGSLFFHPAELFFASNLFIGFKPFRIKKRAVDLLCYSIHGVHKDNYSVIDWAPLPNRLCALSCS